MSDIKKIQNFSNETKNTVFSEDTKQMIPMRVLNNATVNSNTPTTPLENRKSTTDESSNFEGWVLLPGVQPTESNHNSKLTIEMENLKIKNSNFGTTYLP